MLWKPFACCLLWLLAFSPFVEAQFVSRGAGLRLPEVGPSCVSPDGRFFYQGTYKDVIGVYSIGNEGQLSLVEQVKTTNSIQVLPSVDGQWLLAANQNDILALYLRNKQTGKLQQRNTWDIVKNLGFSEKTYIKQLHFSPDGRKLAIQLFHNGTQPNNKGQYYVGIFHFNTQTGQLDLAHGFDGEFFNFSNSGQQAYIKKWAGTWPETYLDVLDCNNWSSLQRIPVDNGNFRLWLSESQEFVFDTYRNRVYILAVRNSNINALVQYLVDPQTGLLQFERLNNEPILAKITVQGTQMNYCPRNIFVTHSHIVAHYETPSSSHIDFFRIQDNGNLTLENRLDNPQFLEGTIHNFSATPDGKNLYLPGTIISTTFHLRNANNPAPGYKPSPILPNPVPPTPKPEPRPQPQPQPQPQPDPRPQPQPNTCALSETALSATLAQIQNLRESDKLAQIQQQWTGRCLQSDQMERIVGSFKLEITRIRFLEWAYPNCSDKENCEALGEYLNIPANQERWKKLVGQ